jgi:predicted ArsR family transcriptional regulator
VLEVLANPLIVPDPRICRRTTDRVLRLLATRGQASARQAAASLHVSLRAVQGALNELAHSQACTVTRDGRSVLYTVEDTIFSQPTQRFRLADLAAPASALDAAAVP